jgi:hypothetical protein
MIRFYSLLRAAVIAGCGLLLPAPLIIPPAAAKIVTFSGTGAGFPINLPDNWRVKTIERGLEITSPDKEIYLWVEAIDATTVDRVVQSYFDYFKQQGVITSQPIAKKKDVIGGVDVILMDIPARSKGANTIVRLLIADPRPNERKGLFIGYWASPKGDKQHEETMGGIITDLLRP